MNAHLIGKLLQQVSEQQWIVLFKLYHVSHTLVLILILEQSIWTVKLINHVREISCAHTDYDDRARLL